MMAKALWTTTDGPLRRVPTQLDELNVQRQLWGLCKTTEEIQAEVLKASRKRRKRKDC